MKQIQKSRFFINALILISSYLMGAQAAVTAEARDSECMPMPMITMVQSLPDNAIPGSEISIHLVLKNTGCVDATDLSVIDELPVGMTFRGASLAPAQKPDGTSNGGKVSWENITVSAMSSISIDINAFVHAHAGTLQNRACESEPSAHAPSCTTLTLQVGDAMYDGEHGTCGAHGIPSGGGHSHGHGGGGGTCACPHGMACTMDVSNACDMTFTSDQVPPRSTIRLVGDAVHPCTPQIGPNGDLLSGNGITIEANNVTLDLNGHRIESTADATHLSGATTLSRNTGITVIGRNVVVTNSSKVQVSGIQGFTTNVDVSRTVGTTLVGSKITQMRDDRTSSASNLEVSGDYGGGALLADGSQSLLLSSVRLSSLNPLSGCAVTFIHGYDFEVRDSEIEGMSGGIEIQNAEDVRILDNPEIRGHKESGILFSHSVVKAIVSGNTVEKNMLDGITIGRDSKGIRIENNRIRYNWGYGVSVNRRGCSDIKTSPNLFTLNARGDTDYDFLN